MKGGKSIMLIAKLFSKKFENFKTMQKLNLKKVLKDAALSLGQSWKLTYCRARLSSSG